MEYLKSLIGAYKHGYNVYRVQLFHLTLLFSTLLIIACNCSFFVLEIYVFIFIVYVIFLSLCGLLINSNTNINVKKIFLKLVFFLALLCGFWAGYIKTFIILCFLVSITYLFNIIEQILVDLSVKNSKKCIEYSWTNNKRWQPSHSFWGVIISVICIILFVFIPTFWLPISFYGKFLILIIYFLLIVPSTVFLAERGVDISIFL